MSIDILHPSLLRALHNQATCLVPAGAVLACGGHEVQGHVWHAQHHADQQRPIRRPPVPPHPTLQQGRSGMLTSYLTSIKLAPNKSQSLTHGYAHRQLSLFASLQNDLLSETALSQVVPGRGLTYSVILNKEQR